MPQETSDISAVTGSANYEKRAALQLRMPSVRRTVTESERVSGQPHVATVSLFETSREVENRSASSLMIRTASSTDSDAYAAEVEDRSRSANLELDDEGEIRS